MPNPLFKKTILFFTVLAVTICLSLGSDAAFATDSRPNVLFILTEDQGAHLGALGTAGLETPNIDALARKGMLFEEAFVDYPVCSASKAAIYTGLHGHAHGIPSNTPNFFKPAEKLSEAERNLALYKYRRIHEEVPTLVELLHAAGYLMRVTDKLHVAPNEKFPYDQWGPSTPKTAAQFINEAETENRPWFLWYNIRDPHRKFTDSDVNSIDVDPQDVEVPAFLPDTEIVRQDIAEYYEAIQRADRKVGAVLKALAQSESQDNTIVIFMGDHGPAFQRGKMSPYDFGLRVPLIVTGPHVKKGARSRELVTAVDLMPTILDYSELPAPSRQHGQSIRPLLEGVPGAQGHPYLVCQVQHEAQQHDRGMRERSVYDGRFRLIYRDKPELPRIVNADITEWEHWGNRTYAETIAKQEQFPFQFELLRQIDNTQLKGRPLAEELYDVKSDRYEVKNLIDDPNFDKTELRLKGYLYEWARRTGDHSLVHLARLSLE